jgi:hypothetical protein
MGWVAIELIEWERVISLCMVGTSMICLIVVLVGTMSASICTIISPMSCALIVGVSLLTPYEWWMANITRRGEGNFSELGIRGWVHIW